MVESESDDLLGALREDISRQSYSCPKFLSPEANTTIKVNNSFRVLNSALEEVKRWFDPDNPVTDAILLDINRRLSMDIHRRLDPQDLTTLTTIYLLSQFNLLDLTHFGHPNGTSHVTLGRGHVSDEFVIKSWDRLWDSINEVQRKKAEEYVSDIVNSEHAAPRAKAMFESILKKD